MLWHVRYANWENPQLTLLTLVPFPGTPSLPSPIAMEMDWFRTYDIPRNCPNTEKTRLLGLRVEGPPLSNRVEQQEQTAAQKLQGSDSSEQGRSSVRL